jgi:molybdopterin synthase catalytic subunit
MLINVSISEGALEPATPLHVTEAGAVICFEGVVRGREDGRLLEALLYETYDPMTLRELKSLALDVGAKHDLLGIHVQHSRGSVPAGQVSFRLQIASKHRAEAIASMDEFINRLKREVPLWKLPVWHESEVKT